MLAHNIADLIQLSTGATLVVELDGAVPDLSPELDLAGPTTGRARLHRTQRGIVAQCQVTTAVRLECSRCLEPMIQPMQIKFDEEFVIEGPGVEIEPDVFQVDEHHVLDLTEAIRQYLTLALPLAPICRTDCAGLCPDCGEPLAEGHECALGDIPSGPFAALARLRDQTE